MANLVKFWKGTTFPTEGVNANTIYFNTQTNEIKLGNTFVGNYVPTATAVASGNAVPTNDAIIAYINGLGYATATALETTKTNLETKIANDISTALSSVIKFMGVVASESALPAASTAAVGHMYIVTNAGASEGVDQNIEFVCVNDGEGAANRWERLGVIKNWSTLATVEALTAEETARTAADTAIKTAVAGVTVNGAHVATVGADGALTAATVVLDGGDLKLGNEYSAAEGGSIANLTPDTSLTAAFMNVESALSAITGGDDPDSGSLAQLAARVTTAEGKITTAEGEIDTLQASVGTAEGKISTIEGEIDALQALTDGMTSESITTIKGYVDSQVVDLRTALTWLS